MLDYSVSSQLSERVSLFLTDSFLASRPALIASMILYESHTGYLFPDSFTHAEMNLSFGDTPFSIGRLDERYFFGLCDQEQHWTYYFYESKEELRSFFIDVQEKGVFSEEDISLILHHIQLIPVR